MTSAYPKSKHPLIDWLKRFKPTIYNQLGYTSDGTKKTRRKRHAGDSCISLFLPLAYHFEMTGLNDALADTHVIRSCGIKNYYLNLIGHALVIKEGFVYGLIGFDCVVMPTDRFLAAVIEYQFLALDDNNRIVKVMFIDRPLPCEVKMPKPLASVPCTASSSLSSGSQLLFWVGSYKHGLHCFREFQADEFDSFGFLLTEDNIICRLKVIHPNFAETLHRVLKRFKTTFLMVPGLSGSIAEKIHLLVIELLIPLVSSGSVKHLDESELFNSTQMTSLFQRAAIKNKPAVKRYVYDFLLHRYMYQCLSTTLWTYAEQESHELDEAFSFYVESILKRSSKTQPIIPSHLGRNLQVITDWLEQRGFSNMALLDHLLEPCGLVCKIKKLYGYGGSRSYYDKLKLLTKLVHDTKICGSLFFPHCGNLESGALLNPVYGFEVVDWVIDCFVLTLFLWNVTTSQKVFSPFSICLLLSCCLVWPLCSLPADTVLLKMLSLSNTKQENVFYPYLDTLTQCLYSFFQHISHQISQR